MKQAVSKQPFGIPSLTTATRIDDSDAAAAASAAHYRFSARMHELTAQFEVKAAELRASYVAELAAIHSDHAEGDES